jgi:N-acetylmuramoyl-L-alanine amidase
MNFISCFFSKMNFRFPLICSGIFLALFFFSYTVHAQAGRQLNTLILDAGHGGTDIGTPHFRLDKDEKDITLDVVLKLGKILKDSMPNLKVVYTRTTDTYPKLEERHKIANDAKGDLFISIHVNATAVKRIRVASGHRYVGKGKHRRRVTTYKTIHQRETDAHGTETFVLGLHRTSQKSQAIEDYGENFSERSGLLDVNDPTTQIIVAQYTQSFLSRSINFADKVQQNFVKQGRYSYGVKQMGLEVLAGSAMPGALIEVGFINNPDDERYLNSEAGQTQIAMAVYHAIKAYKQDLERGKAN